MQYLFSLSGRVAQVTDAEGELGATKGTRSNAVSAGLIHRPKAVTLLANEVYIHRRIRQCYAPCRRALRDRVRGRLLGQPWWGPRQRPKLVADGGATISGGSW